jgi:hypothetical protein
MTENAAWTRAWARYLEDHGGEPHLDYYEDRAAFLALLEAAVREDMDRALDALFREAADRLREVAR